LKFFVSDLEVGSHSVPLVRTGISRLTLTHNTSPPMSCRKKKVRKEKIELNFAKTGCGMHNTRQ